MGNSRAAQVIGRPPQHNYVGYRCTSQLVHLTTNGSGNRLNGPASVTSNNDCATGSSKEVARTEIRPGVQRAIGFGNFLYSR